MTFGRVAEIWRYPVKGLQGEKLRESRVLTTGISGDRLYVLRAKGSNRVLHSGSRLASGEERPGRPAMLEVAARLSGEPEGEHEVSIQASGLAICSSRDPWMNRVVSATLGSLRLHV